MTLEIRNTILLSWLPPHSVRRLAEVPNEDEAGVPVSMEDDAV